MTFVDDVLPYWAPNKDFQFKHWQNARVLQPNVNLIFALIVFTYNMFVPSCDTSISDFGHLQILHTHTHIIWWSISIPRNSFAALFPKRILRPYWGVFFPRGTFRFYLRLFLWHLHVIVKQLFSLGFRNTHVWISSWRDCHWHGQPLADAVWVISLLMFKIHLRGSFSTSNIRI